jgi:hypothetical protein
VLSRFGFCEIIRHPRAQHSGRIVPRELAIEAGDASLFLVTAWIKPARATHLNALNQCLTKIFPLVGKEAGRIRDVGMPGNKPLQLSDRLRKSARHLRIIFE